MRITLMIFFILFAVLFAVFGVYIGVWEMLIGGIVQIIDGVKETPTNAYMIAIGICRVIFFEIPIGVGVFLGIIFAASCKKI